MTEILDLIMNRRSIRRYSQEQVSENKVEDLLRAAMAAPSASNKKPWSFVVVRNPEKLALLSKVHKYSDMCARAALVIVVLGDPEISSFWVEDCSAATENLLLAASGLGLGSVWVAIHPEAEDEASVRSILQIPDRLRVLCLLPVGYPAESKPPRTQFDPERVHLDSY